MKVTDNSLAKYAVDQIELGVSAKDVADMIASLLLDEKRTRDLPRVIRAIEEELASRGSQQVVITSANEVDEQTKKQLAGLLGVENPVFSEVVDKSVIGGVKARSGETELDLTVRAKLNKFKSRVVRR